MPPVFSHLVRDPGVVAAAAGAVLLLAGTGIYFARRKRPTPEEIERARRDYLLRAGRIIDGTVLDIAERTGEQGQNVAERCVFYKYEIAGVVYECSQDVTLLDEQMSMATSTPGFPASVRYDPHNPTNSIVIAESWNGLRHSARVLRMDLASR